MLLDDLRAELARLQLHPVNLSVSIAPDGQVALRGSLLQYAKISGCVEGSRMLAALRNLPDAAGAAAIMTSLDEALAVAEPTSEPVEERPRSACSIRIPHDPKCSLFAFFRNTHD